MSLLMLTLKTLTSLGLISQKDILSSPLPLFSQKFGKLEINITCVEECMTINEENTLEPLASWTNSKKKGKWKRSKVRKLTLIQSTPS